ncbi:PDZ domain-containing protein [Roseiconus lacunae]|uniref:PDZ domain-containing protein n=1 Tax=Roseiconus lacunae TaxID=2605694 RepID=UPI0030877C8C|nr:PDZ domain-containing protein [Stieleria sp. HD01]
MNALTTPSPKDRSRPEESINLPQPVFLLPSSRPRLSALLFAGVFVMGVASITPSSASAQTATQTTLIEAEPETIPAGATEVTIRSVDDVIVALGRLERDLKRPRQEPVAVRTGDGQPLLGVLMKDSPLGVEVESVIDGSAAAMAGLTKGDKIVEINQFNIEKPGDVNDAIANHAVGSKLKVKWIRHNVSHQREIVFVPQQPPAEGTIAGRPDPETQRLREEVVVLRRQVQALTRAVRSLALLHQ